MKLDPDKVIVIQWFTRKDLEDVVGEKVSKKNFADFKNVVEGTGLMDEMSERIRVMWDDGDWRNFRD
jgi:DNA gyrase inhibitor GyrI